MGMTRRSFFASLLAALGFAVYPTPIPRADWPKPGGPDSNPLHQQVFS